MNQERKPGRPPADGTDQRERLLDTALESFSRIGIAATRLRGLAREAEVSPAMLNYYFGSKDRLVDAVLEERLLPLLESQRQRLESDFDGSCASLIEKFIRGLHEMIAGHPWLPGLWVREVLSDGGQFRSVFTDRFASRLPRPLAERFARGQIEGQLNDALDPRLLFVSLIGLSLMPFAAAPIWRRVFDADDISAEDMLEHTLALLSGGINP